MVIYVEVIHAGSLRIWTENCLFVYDTRKVIETIYVRRALECGDEELLGPA